MNKHTIHRHSVVFLVLILAVSLQVRAAIPMKNPHRRQLRQGRQ